MPFHVAVVAILMLAGHAYGQATALAQLAQSATEIISVITAARAGQTVLIRPGTYRIDQNIKTNAAGTEQQRITVRASQPGQVHIEFTATEGFTVQHPYWVFENLHIRGVCQDHSQCEHAFHVVGNGANLVLRNNLLEDYNAHIKVNGLNGFWPDSGQVLHNTLTNTAPRNTGNPVTPFDLVGSNNWLLADNLISNFVKTGSNQISIGAFMKGGGTGGRMERNLVICTPKDVAQAGARLGLSFGGGTTGKQFCRDQRCDAEHTNGVITNNIVAHCNDVGIEVNRSSNILVAHNTLINTAGIDVRSLPASARIYGNLLNGRIRQRDGGLIEASANDIISTVQFSENVDLLQFSRTQSSAKMPAMKAAQDFCSRPGQIIDTVHKCVGLP